MKLGLIFAFLYLFGCGVRYCSAHEELGEGTVTLRGEVVDLVGYVREGESVLGLMNAPRSRERVQLGLPVGLKTKDELYVPVLRNDEPATEALIILMGREVVVTGKVLERDGLHIIEISGVELAQ